MHELSFDRFLHLLSVFKALSVRNVIDDQDISVRVLIERDTILEHNEVEHVVPDLQIDRELGVLLRPNEHISVILVWPEYLLDKFFLHRALVLVRLECQSYHLLC